MGAMENDYVKEARACMNDMTKTSKVFHIFHLLHPYSHWAPLTDGNVKASLVKQVSICYMCSGGSWTCYSVRDLQNKNGCAIPAKLITTSAFDTDVNKIVGL